MKPSSISDIKKELSTLDKKQLVEVAGRLARYKKENKELISYLLFYSDNETGYLDSVKNEIENQFKLINKTNIYFAKKSIRKGLRIVNKYIRYSGKKSTEADVLIHFCKLMKESGINFTENTALNNLYNRQTARIRKAIDTLHEDLQYDYNKEYEKLIINKKENVLNKIFRRK